MNIRKNLKKGFTLVELLVVVAIIAIIGAGVAVTYRNLTDKAETSMEISDCAILTKTISHWSAINNGNLPNELDTLVDEHGKFYSQMIGEEMGVPASGVTGSAGVSGPIGYTAMVQDAPDEVVATLRAGGLRLAYKHLSTATVANDSTFEGGIMGANVDTTKTAVLMQTSTEDDRHDAQALVDSDLASDIAEWLADESNAGQKYKLGTQGTSGESITLSDESMFKGEYASVADYNKEKQLAQRVVNTSSDGKVRLAFVYPGAGAQITMGPMGKQTMAMNQTDKIITNAGLLPEDIEDPTNMRAWKQGRDGATYIGDKRYYLVVMGIGRFASIYGGKSVRVDVPAYGKRSGQSEASYNRYLAVIRVPTTGYDSMTGKGEKPSVVAVLTPEGYSAASLRDKLIQDDENMKD